MEENLLQLASQWGFDRTAVCALAGYSYWITRRFLAVTERLVIALERNNQFLQSVNDSLVGLRVGMSSRETD